MRIKNVYHIGEMGGGCEALDIHLDNGFIIRVFNGSESVTLLGMECKEGGDVISAVDEALGDCDLQTFITPKAFSARPDLAKDDPDGFRLIREV